MWLSVYMCPIPTIAAINGASPAGGCQIAMSCDYRIMAKHPKIVIGLNETALGIVAPTWVHSLFIAASSFFSINLQLANSYYSYFTSIKNSRKYRDYY